MLFELIHLDYLVKYLYLAVAIIYKFLHPSPYQKCSDYVRSGYHYPY